METLKRPVGGRKTTGKQTVNVTLSLPCHMVPLLEEVKDRTNVSALFREALTKYARKTAIAASK